MMLAEAGGSLGVIEPLVEWWRGRGELAGVEFRAVRGDPAVVDLSVPLDRDLVEGAFDLGPLLAWWPHAAGRWQLVDTLTGTTVRGGAGVSDNDGDAVATVSGGRTRVGWVADRAADWAAEWSGERGGLPPATDEIARVRRTEADDVRCDWRFVAAEDWEMVLGRVEEVLGAVLVPLAGGAEPAGLVEALPQWFVKRCAAPYVAGSPAPGFDSGDLMVDRVARWASQWTPVRWLQSMAPQERTWVWVGSRPAAPGVRLLRYERRWLSAPVGSLKWLLHAAGSGPGVEPPYVVDQWGRPAVRRESSPTPPPSSLWQDLAALIRRGRQ